MNMENMDTRAVDRICIYCEQCREKMEVARWSRYGWVESEEASYTDEEGAVHSTVGLFMRKHTHLSCRSYDDGVDIAKAHRVVGFGYDREGIAGECKAVSKQQLIEWTAYVDVLKQLENVRFELDRLTKLKESYEDSMRNGGNASFSSMMAILMNEKENERKKEEKE